MINSLFYLMFAMNTLVFADASLGLDVKKLPENLYQDSVRPFLAERLDIGGYLENSFTSISGESTKSQSIFDLQKIGLNLVFHIDDELQVVMQQGLGFNYAFRNEHNNPGHGISELPVERKFEGPTFGAFLSQAFLKIQKQDGFVLKLGMGYVPFGRSFQVREPVLFTKFQGPQQIQTNGAVDIIIADPLWKGVLISGQIGKIFKYDLYTNSPLNNNGKIGFGGRLSLENLSHFSGGVSLQSGSKGEFDYLALGADLQYKSKYMKFLIEAAENKTKLDGVRGLYALLSFNLIRDKLELFLNYDYLKNLLGLTTYGASYSFDPYIKAEYGVGVSYFIRSQVKIRFQYDSHDYLGDTAQIGAVERDYESFSVSTGVSF